MKRNLAIVLFSILAISAWASGSADVSSFLVSHTTVEREAYGRIQIEPTSEILEIFNSFGVESQYLTAGTEMKDIPTDVKDDIDDIIVDDEDGVVGLIKDTLKDSLKNSDSEEAFMVLGEHLFTVSIP